MTGRLAIFLVLLTCAFAAPAAAGGRRVIFVDNSRAEEGSGTADQPFRRLAAAQSRSALGDIIYVAEGSAPYDEGMALKQGQMLVGAAYGLEALRADFHLELEAPIVAAVQGPGPIIRGTVSAAGDNLVAGCTIATRRIAGLVSSPQGTLTIRDVWFRPSQSAMAIAIDGADAAVSIRGGGVIAESGGSGISISGGGAPVTIDRFPISGQVGTAVFVGNRSGGTVKFGLGSSVKLDGAAHDAIIVVRSKGSIVFNDPIQIVAQGSRGLSVMNSDNVVVSGAPSRITSTNAAAVDIRDSTVDIVLESVSAEAALPGRLVEGIVLNKLRGRFTVAGDTAAGRGSGGTIRDAQAYGIRVEQSAGVRIAHVNVIETGAMPARLKCPEDLDGKANVVCRAGLFVRHVTQSTFEDILIEHAGQVGLNANNIGEVTFRDLDVRQTQSLPGVLLQEAIGNVVFDHCSITDASGGAVYIEQRFNRGRVSFDRCTMAGAPHLLTARTAGFGALHLELKSIQLRDSSGSAVQIRSSEKSSIAFDMSDARAQRLGGHLLEVSASQASHAAASVQGGFIAGSGEGISITVEASAEACVDLAGNHFDLASSTTPIRLAVRSPNARLRVVSAPSAAIEAPPGTVTAVSSCN